MLFKLLAIEKSQYFHIFVTVFLQMYLIYLYISVYLISVSTMMLARSTQKKLQEFLQPC